MCVYVPVCARGGVFCQCVCTPDIVHNHDTSLTAFLTFVLIVLRIQGGDAGQYCCSKEQVDNIGSSVSGVHSRLPHCLLTPSMCRMCEVSCFLCLCIFAVPLKLCTVCMRLRGWLDASL